LGISSTARFEFVNNGDGCNDADFDADFGDSSEVVVRSPRKFSATAHSRTPTAQTAGNQRLRRVFVSMVRFPDRLNATITAGAFSANRGV
jgi:hypothetical protein